MTPNLTQTNACASKMSSASEDQDQLTQFLNRVGLTKHLEAQTKTPRLSIIHLDFEHFGLINQKFGRRIGDNLIRSAAHRIRSAVGTEHRYCRPAGDELLILLNACNKEDLLTYVYRIQDTLEKPFEIGGQHITLSANIGVARCPHDSNNPERLPDLAECALRQSKLQLDPIAFFNPGFHLRMQRTIDVEQALKSAILNNKLEVYLQPKLDFATREIVGFEALLRWQDSELGCVMPDEFISIAEQSLLGQQLDFFVLRSVCSLIAERNFLGLATPPIAINIGAGHFSDPELTGNLNAILSAADVEPSAIILEVTEGVLMERNCQVAPNLKNLRALGYAIAIDDFGTGYSALSYLKFIPATELKIDKSFISDIDSDQGQTLIRIIISLARAYDLVVTAEGVETKAQQTFLQSLGCEQGQGFFLAQPKPALSALGMLPA